jgi:hypothetical protein
MSKVRVDRGNSVDLDRCGPQPVTMYNAQGLQAANSPNRVAIGDRDPLQFNSDGSLDLYLQHESPGADKEANWLPAPTGPPGLRMRP